jgi:hypothetical protein
MGYLVLLVVPFDWSPLFLVIPGYYLNLRPLVTARCTNSASTQGLFFDTPVASVETVVYGSEAIARKTRITRPAAAVAAPARRYVNCAPEYSTIAPPMP